jgi:hypothetical protein
VEVRLLSAALLTDEEQLARAIQESLATFARLRAQMHADGPAAVAALLNSMGESELRQVLLALVVTTERAGQEDS